MRRPGVSHAYEPTMVPMSSVIDNKFAVTCVRLSGFVALLTAIVSGISLFVYMGNEHLTDNFLAFALCMLLVCPVCSLSSICAIKRNSNKAALLFVITTVFAFASLLGVMIAFLVEPDDQQSLAWLFPGSVFLIVGQYTVVLLGVALAFYCGMRLSMIIRTGRLGAVLKGEEPPPTRANAQESGSANVGGLGNEYDSGSARSQDVFEISSHDGGDGL